MMKASSYLDEETAGRMKRHDCGREDAVENPDPTALKL